MKQVHVGLDIDDVIFDLNTGFLQFFNEKKNTSYTRAHLVKYHYEDIFDVEAEEVHDLLNEYSNSSRHLETTPVPGAIEGLKQLRHTKISLISARPEKRREVTLAWFKKHAPNLLDDKPLVLTGQYRKETDIKKTKGEIAKENGVDIFVEDALHNAEEIACHGIPVLLYDTPWNQASVLPPLITRVYSWEEIVQKIQSLSEEI